MFGKKKRLAENDTMTMNQQPYQDDELPPLISADVVRQGLQAQQMQMPQQYQYQQPMIQQPVQIQQPMIQQPIQQQNQNRAEAIIIEAKISEGGDYYYVIKANYPLGVGYCNLSQ